MTDRFLEQRINIKFCVKLGNNASDTCAVLSKAYGGEAVETSSVFEWHKQFKEGCKDMEDDEQSGCPRTHRANENVEKNVESRAFR